VGTARWLNRRGLKKAGYVYFIQSGGDGGPIKIGHSVDVADRLKTLQTSSPFELVLLGTMKFEHPWQAAAFEHRLHHEVFWDLRLRGEWFRCDARILRFVRTVVMTAEQYTGTDKTFDLHIRSVDESGEDFA
jgi:hypothetical protein